MLLRHIERKINTAQNCTGGRSQNGWRHLIHGNCQALEEPQAAVTQDSSKAQIRQQRLESKDRMADAGFKPQQQQQPPAAHQQNQKPLTQAPKSGRKPQNRKPAKR